MPHFRRGPVSIHYEVRGDGYPLLLLAPGGMRSALSVWSHEPGRPKLPWINPLEDLSDDFLVIGMDQRNAGESEAPIRADDGWSVYLEDQLSLMDHLGHRRFHVMGGCIGSSYALGLCKAAPGRVTAAVLQNPIGIVNGNRPKFYAMFDEWVAEKQLTHAELNEAVADAVRTRLFGGDFVFSVDRAFVSECTTSLLVMPGDDDFHPRAVADEIVSLAPHAKLLTPWAGDANRSNTLARVRDFLVSHS